MKAPWCLRWRNTLPRYREPPRMVRCPLNASAVTLLFGSFIVIVLCVTVTSVSGSITDSVNCPVRHDASDASSRAAVSAQVVQGVLISRMPLGVSSYEASFRVTRVLKKYRGAGRLKKNKIVSFTFKNPSFRLQNDCVVHANVFPRRKYFLFASGAARRKDPLYPVAPPLLVTKRLKKRIKAITCKDCALAPSVGRLRNDSVVRGHLVNLTCIFDGNPLPSVTWAKNDVEIDPAAKGVRIRTRRRRLRRNGRFRRVRLRHRRHRELKRRRQLKQHYKRKNVDRPRVRVLSTLVIRHADDTDMGEYSCRGRSVLGEASSHAFLSVVPPFDPGFIHPCPYDSYCLNGGTCMFFKIFGEFVCQCAEGFKGQRCQEKVVFFPSFVDPNCRGPMSHSRSSKGVRCLRNQPLELWQILQQALADHKRGIPMSTPLDNRLMPSVVASLRWHLTKGSSSKLPSQSRYLEDWTGLKSEGDSKKRNTLSDGISRNTSYIISRSKWGNNGSPISSLTSQHDNRLTTEESEASFSLKNDSYITSRPMSAKNRSRVSSLSSTNDNRLTTEENEASFSLPRQSFKTSYWRKNKSNRNSSNYILVSV